MRIYDERWKATCRENKGRILEYIRQREESVECIEEKELKSDSITCSFYPEWQLVRARGATWQPNNKIWYFLVSDEKIVRLDGTRIPINRVNKEGALVIESYNCLEYLKFFCFFVRAAQGPFLIVTSITEDYLPKSIDGTIRKEMERGIEEPKIEYETEKREYYIDANVYYGNALYRARFSIAESGEVEMMEDDEIVSDVPFEINAPIG